MKYVKLLKSSYVYVLSSLVLIGYLAISAGAAYGGSAPTELTASNVAEVGIYYAASYDASLERDVTLNELESFTLINDGQGIDTGFYTTYSSPFTMLVFTFSQRDISSLDIDITYHAEGTSGSSWSVPFSDNEAYFLSGKEVFAWYDPYLVSVESSSGNLTSFFGSRPNSLIVNESSYTYDYSSFNQNGNSGHTHSYALYRKASSNSFSFTMEQVNSVSYADISLVRIKLPNTYLSSRLIIDDIHIYIDDVNMKLLNYNDRIINKANGLIDDLNEKNPVVDVGGVEDILNNSILNLTDTSYVSMLHSFNETTLIFSILTIAMSFSLISFILYGIKW